MENYKPGSVVCKPFTTFVQTDTQTFREIVQLLTGPSESKNVAQEGETLKVAGVRRSTSKFHERRQYMRPKLEIVKPGNTNNYRPCFSPCKSRSGNILPNPEFGIRGCLSSPVTPMSLSKLSILDDDKMVESATPVLNSEDEEATKERRFYLLPSPRSRSGYTQPKLLTLFPVTSPRFSEKL